MWILLRIVPRSNERILKRIYFSFLKITIYSFLPKIVTDDDKVVRREAIKGENIINEGNHDDHAKIYGDDGENHTELNQISI
jgi:TnpA family transposase